VDDDERATAMRELRRVATPDAPVFVSVISRFAPLRDIMKFSLESSHGLKPELEDASDEAVESVREVVRMLREDRAVVDFSEHMLAVCRA
jgi:hypothetical protein